MKIEILVLCIMLFHVSISCVEEIPLTIESPKKVVVNCLLTNKEQQTIEVVYSKAKNGGVFYEPVKDVVISLFKNDTLIGVFEKKSTRTWEINHLPVPCSIYKLEISIPNQEKIFATTRMPSEPQISFISETLLKKRFVQKSQPLNQWVFALNAKFDHDDEDDKNRWLNPLIVPEINSSDKLIEHIATNHLFADRFNQAGNLTDLIGEEATLPAYEFYIRLNSNSGSVRFDIEAPFHQHCFITFRNSSIEYDMYLKTSFQKMKFYEDEDDPIIWFDENIIYNNIENGVGVFGAYNDKVFVFGTLKIP